MDFENELISSEIYLTLSEIPRINLFVVLDQLSCTYSLNGTSNVKLELWMIEKQRKLTALLICFLLLYNLWVNIICVLNKETISMIHSKNDPHFFRNAKFAYTIRNKKQGVNQVFNSIETDWTLWSVKQLNMVIFYWDE